MAISAAGIGSNLDVNGLVTQLMAIERQPLNRLQGRVSASNTDLSEYGRLRSEVAAVESAARALGGATAVDVFRATLSSPDAASVSVGSGATAGQYALQVTSLARAQTLVSPNSADGGATRISDPAAALSGAADLVLRRGASSFTVSLAAASLNGVRDAINAASANFGVAASVINDGSGYRLVLRAEDSGADNALTGIDVSDPAGSYGFLQYTAGTAYTPAGTTMGQSVAASDAEIVVDGVTVRSTTNAFASAIQGVTLVATATTAAPVTLTVARDAAALQARAQSFVDAYNTFMSNAATRYGKGGTLAAEGSVLTMMNGFSSLLAQAGGSDGNAYAYLSQAGFSVDKNGRMSLDASALRSAVDSDAGAVGRLFGDASTGIMTRFAALSAAYLGSGGLIGAREEGIRASVTRLAERIDAFNSRLTVIEARYRAQFASLDALLGRLNQTSLALSRALG